MSFRAGIGLMGLGLKSHVSFRSLQTSTRSLLQAGSRLQPLFPGATFRFAKVGSPIPGEQIRAHSSKPSSVILGILGRRSFTSSSCRSIRQTYFPKKGSGGPRPSQSWYLWLENRLLRFGMQRIILTIIGINVAVFLIWQYAKISYAQGAPGLFALMYNNFTLSWHNLAQGRYWTLLTAAFSHMGFMHLAFNMVTVYFISGTLVQMIGPVALLGIYLGGAISAHAVSLWMESRPRQGNGGAHTVGLGASGPAYALMACVGVLQPFTSFYLFFIPIPIPAWGLIAGISAYELYQVIASPGNRTSPSVVHLSGLVFGGAAALYLRKTPYHQVWKHISRR